MGTVAPSGGGRRGRPRPALRRPSSSNSPAAAGGSPTRGRPRRSRGGGDELGGRGQLRRREVHERRDAAVRSALRTRPRREQVRKGLRRPVRSSSQSSSGCLREGGRVEERRVAGRGRWLIRRFRNRAAGRVPWVRFLPPLSEPGGPISGTGLSSGIMRLAHGLPGHDQQTGLASPGTRLAPLSRPAGASSGLLTPWRRRPLGSSPSLVHVMTSGIPAHLRGDRPSATPVSLLPFAIAST